MNLIKDSDYRDEVPLDGSFKRGGNMEICQDKHSLQNVKQEHQQGFWGKLFGEVGEMIKPHLNPQRNVTITFVNQTKNVLRREGSNHSSGAFGTLPKTEIQPGDSDTYRSINYPLFFQGACGTITYSVDSDSHVTLEWNNPFIGKNNLQVDISGDNAVRYSVNAEIGAGNEAKLRCEIKQLL